VIRNHSKQRNLGWNHRRITYHQGRVGLPRCSWRWVGSDPPQQLAPGAGFMAGTSVSRQPANGFRPPMQRPPGAGSSRGHCPFGQGLGPIPPAKGCGGDAAGWGASRERSSPKPFGAACSSWRTASATKRLRLPRCGRFRRTSSDDMVHAHPSAGGLGARHGREKVCRASMIISDFPMASPVPGATAAKTGMVRRAPTSG